MAHRSFSEPQLADYARDGFLVVPGLFDPAYVTYSRLSDGDHRALYYADKRKSYPPDCEREPGKQYVYRI